MAAEFTVIRKAFRDILVGDPTLTALMGGTSRVFYLRVRKPAEIPAISYFEFGDRPDIQVPLHERLLSIDIWANNFIQAEDIGARIRELLDRVPITIPTGEFFINFIFFEGEREAPLEEGDIVQKTLEFRYSAYQLTSNPFVV